MKKMLSLLASLSFVSASASAALLVVQNNNLNPKQLPVGTKMMKLNEVLTQHELGILENDSDQEILKLAQFNNPKLKINEVEVVKLTQTLANITPIRASKVYEQNLIGVQVTFQVQEKQWLKTALQQTMIGEVVDDSPEAILTGVKKLNPNLKIADLSLRLNTITDQTAIVRANLNGIYKGEVLIHYALAPKKISRDLSSLTLGFLPNNDQSTIFNQLIKINPNLITSEITFKDFTLNSVKLVANENSVIYLPNDEVTITFTTSPNSLKDDLTIRNLGQIRNSSWAEITQVLKRKTQVHLDEIQIFDIVGFSCKIQAKAESHYYRVEPPLMLNFTLPKKVDLSDHTKFGFFKLVNYRPQGQLIATIKTMIGEKRIEYGRDFVIEGLKENVVGDKKLPKDGLLVVKSTSNSEYLMGKFEFKLIPPINLNRFNGNNKQPTIVKDDEIIKDLTQKIKNYLTEIKLKEDFIPILESLKIKSTSKIFPFKHAGKKYYQTIHFEIKKSDFFENQITWNLQAPIYRTSEIKLAVDKTPMISFIDSTDDKNYPDYNSNHKTSKYFNQNHHPLRKRWNTTSPIVFGTIAYQEDFNLSLRDFFSNYNIRLNYKYANNVWCSAFKAAWWSPTGKKLPFVSTSKVFRSEADKREPKTNSTSNTKSHAGYDIFNGEFGGYKAAAAVQIYMQIDQSKKVIKIGGVAAAWYDWNDDSPHGHAAFARLKATSLELIPKKH